MKLDDLISLNQKIKRRLFIDFQDSVCRFKDGRNSVINAKPIGMPCCVNVPNVENPFNDKRRTNKPYDINHLGLASRDYIRGILTKNEAAIILGVDYFKGAKPDDISAMLNACDTGPGLANAYVLGRSYPRISQTKHFVVIPIQYYLIPKKIHDSLALTKEEIAKIKKVG